MQQSMLINLVDDRLPIYKRHKKTKRPERERRHLDCRQN